MAYLKDGRNAVNTECRKESIGQMISVWGKSINAHTKRVHSFPLFHKLAKLKAKGIILVSRHILHLHLLPGTQPSSGLNLLGLSIFAFHLLHGDGAYACCHGPAISRFGWGLRSISGVSLTFFICCHFLEKRRVGFFFPFSGFWFCMWEFHVFLDFAVIFPAAFASFLWETVEEEEDNGTCHVHHFWRRICREWVQIEC